MGIVNFFKSFFRTPQVKTQEIFDKELGTARYDASSDPVIAGRYSPQELKAFLELYGTHPWVYVCASAIANAAASVQFQVMADGKEVDAEERCAWVCKPNPDMTWFEFVVTMFLHLELVGNFYAEIIYG